MTGAGEERKAFRMWSYHPDLLANPVPRYTSFPTAAEFREGPGPADFAEAMGQVKGDISLYVHIPFCENICWYCGCNTAAANKASRLASYLDALHREIVQVAALLPASARVSRVAFGGGSPNALPPVDFVRLYEQLMLHFRLDDPHVSIELDPRMLTPEWKAVMSAVGARKASLGVQTFAPHLQQAIGRVQPELMIESAVDILREAGIASLNFDLMYGLPGQSDEDLAETLRLTARFGADRIALFGYAHVPHLIPRQRQINASHLPGQAERFAMAQAGFRHLTAEGYTPVGFDHFALPGDPLAQAATSGRLHRNFQGFTEDEAPVLIGLGASSISAFPELLLQSEKNAGRYRMLLSQGLLTGSHGIRRTSDDRQRAKIIEDILCRGHAQIPLGLRAEAGARLAPFIDYSLCAYEGQKLVLSVKALPYARSIAACFDPYRQQSARRFSSAI